MSQQPRVGPLRQTDPVPTLRMASDEEKVGKRRGVIVLDTEAANANGHAPLHAVKSGMRADAKKVIGTFSPYEEIMPKKGAEGSYRVGLGIAVLQTILAGMKRLGATRIDLEVPAPLLANEKEPESERNPKSVRTPILGEFSGSDYRATVVFMPVAVSY
jgi:hypothetical protein